MDSNKRPAWIPKTEYVSFDVFDTLIKRSVAKPADLFLLMENYLANTKPEIPAGFARKRQTAEREGRLEAGRHIKLAEIYDRLRGEYGEYSDELMALEIQMEISGCRPNPKCVEWFDRCIAAGKTVILISDMYLPSVVIIEMLEKCGVRGYRKLFVSCECGAQKRDGSLFRVVLGELNIKRSDLLHIGDSRRGDFLVPLSMRIRAVWIRNDQKSICRIPESIKSENELIYRTVKACIRNCSQGMNEYEKMGCRVFGPLLYGFTQWLTAQMQKDGIRDVYFLTRDGYMPMYAFEEQGASDVRVQYLYCSRRSYQVPMMWMHPDFDDVIRPFRYYMTMTLRLLISRVGLDPDKYVEKAGSFGLQLDKTYGKGDIFSSSAVRAFYDSIKEDVIENSRQEYKSLVAYIKSRNFSEKIAVVDVGWYATMQKALVELIQEEKLKVTVKGYYVGIATDASIVASGEIDASGYLYDTERGRELEKDRTRSSMIFEGQFLAPHGSVKRFELDGDQVKPVLEAYEYTEDSTQIIDEPAVISEYQGGAMAFVRYMLDAFPTNTIAVPPEVALYGFARLASHPTLSEANLWGDMRYINFYLAYCARPKSFFRYMLHPNELKHDLRGSNWKVGFMKRLFRVPLPYDKITDAIKKLYYKL